MGHPLFTWPGGVRNLIPIRLSLVVGAATGKKTSLLGASVNPSPLISMLSPSLRERLYATPPPVSPVLLREKMQNAERKRKQRSTSSSCARRPR